MIFLWLLLVILLIARMIWEPSLRPEDPADLLSAVVCLAVLVVAMVIVGITEILSWITC